DRLEDLRNRDSELGERIGFYPNKHRVLSRTKNGHTGDSWHPRKLVVEIRVGVVREKNAFVGALRGVEAEHDQRGRRGLLDRHAELVHVLRKLGRRLITRHLRKNLIG